MLSDVKWRPLLSDGIRSVILLKAIVDQLPSNKIIELSLALAVLGYL